MTGHDATNVGRNVGWPGLGPPIIDVLEDRAARHLPTRQHGGHVVLPTRTPIHRGAPRLEGRPALGHPQVVAAWSGARRRGRRDAAQERCRRRGPLTPWPPTAWSRRRGSDPVFLTEDPDLAADRLDGALAWCCGPEAEPELRCFGEVLRGRRAAFFALHHRDTAPQRTGRGCVPAHLAGQGLRPRVPLAIRWGSSGRDRHSRPRRR
jgi:hypothetical protein